MDLDDPVLLCGYFTLNGIVVTTCMYWTLTNGPYILNIGDEHPLSSQTKYAKKEGSLERIEVILAYFWDNLQSMVS